jgi:hypothetical protein
MFVLGVMFDDTLFYTPASPEGGGGVYFFTNIYWETVRIKNNCLLQCMCIISKNILLYGSDVQLYNEKAFQNNIKSII